MSEIKNTLPVHTRGAIHKHVGAYDASDGSSIV